jgi:GNAT superfamily N-acetyltransferase
MLKLVKTNLYLLRKEQPEIIPILSSLTMGLGGTMQGELLEENLSIKTQRGTKVFMAYNEEKEIVGWSLVFPGLTKNKKQFRHKAHFYTDPSKRKNGIGSFLMESILKWIKKHKKELFVFPWDTKSEKFFSKWNKNEFVKINKRDSLYEGIDNDQKCNFGSFYGNNRKRMKIQNGRTKSTSK